MLLRYDFKNRTIEAKVEVGDEIAAAISSKRDIPIPRPENRPPIVSKAVGKAVERHCDVVACYAIVQVLRDVNFVEPYSQVGNRCPLFGCSVFRILLPLN